MPFTLAIRILNLLFIFVFRIILLRYLTIQFGNMDDDFDSGTDDDDFYFDYECALDDPYDIDEEMSDENQITKGEEATKRQEHLSQIRETAIRFRIRREFNWNHQKVLWLALKKNQKNKRRKKPKKCYLTRIQFDELLLIIFSFLDPNFDYNRVYGGITRIQRKSLEVNRCRELKTVYKSNGDPKKSRRRKGKGRKRSFKKMNE